MLERVIAELPDVCALGEVLHLWQRGVIDNEVCACGQRFYDCPFWTEVGQVGFGGWENVDVDKVRALGARLDRFRFIPHNVLASRRSTRRAQLRAYAEYFYRVYAAAATVSGAAIVVDSSKNASTAFALRAHEQVALRVLHVIRDSRGVAYSWTKRVSRPEADQHSTNPFMETYPPRTAAMLWSAHNVSFAILGLLGTPVRKVFYERFVDDPVTTTTAIADFLGVDSTKLDSFMSSDVVALRPTHQVAGNPMRFRVGTIALSPDDAWRSEMPAGARRLVAAITWPLMKWYGYLLIRSGR